MDLLTCYFGPIMCDTWWLVEHFFTSKFLSQPGWMRRYNGSEGSRRRLPCKLLATFQMWFSLTIFKPKVRDSESTTGDFSVSLKAPGRNKHFRVHVEGGKNVNNGRLVEMCHALMILCLMVVISSDSCLETIKRSLCYCQLVGVG